MNMHKHIAVRMGAKCWGSQTSLTPTCNYCEYDPNSRLYQSLTRTTPGGSQTTQYAYDAFERLTAITEPDGKKTEYQYDPFGNRLAEIITNTGNASATGGTPKPYGRYDYVYHPNSNRLKEIRHTAPNSTATVWESYTYDNAGRITERTHAVQGTTTYTWDDRGLLTQASKPGAVITYTYDALGQRKAKTVNGQTTRYLTAPLFGLSHVLMELAPDMAIQKTYVYGGHDQLIEEPAATDRAKDLYLLHEGTVGSITHATTRTGAIANGYRYEAFGARTVQTPTTPAGSYGFTGEQYDEETGLVYLRARYYDPALGRFISPDPFLGRLAEPSTQNRYVYVKNDPLGYVDPSGLDTEEYYLSVSGNFMGYSGMFSFSRATDGYGNTSYLFEYGGGKALFGNAASVQLGRTTTNADSIDSLTGRGYQQTLSVGPVTSGLVFGTGYSGSTVSVGPGIGVPVSGSSIMTNTIRLDPEVRPFDPGLFNQRIMNGGNVCRM